LPRVVVVDPGDDPMGWVVQFAELAVAMPATVLGDDRQAVPPIVSDNSRVPDL
jgi:hypothetical protein